MIILFIILGFCFWLGYKSGYYIIEISKKDSISLIELLGLIFFTIFFPLSILIAVWSFMENNGDKIVIRRNKNRKIK